MGRRPGSEAMLEWLHDLVTMESPSGDIAGLSDIMEYLQYHLKGLGDVNLGHTEQGPILTIRRGNSGALLLGHADTVWPRGTLRAMMWRTEGDWVYGPGVLDMKGGLALAMAAFMELPADVPFTLLVTPDEEVGSMASRPIIEEAARQAPLVLVLEPGMADGAIKVARAGVGTFLLKIGGRESHAGLDPDDGASALKELAHHILWLDTLADRQRGTTVNVGVASGGTRSNVIPGQATAAIDVRVCRREEMVRIQEALAHPPVFDRRCEIQYTGTFDRPPMELTPSSERWVRQASQIWEKLTGQPLGLARVGGASDGNFTALLAPTLDGLGAVGVGAHARHEGVYWPYMVWRLELLKALIEKVARLP
ncbi:MAG: M20 family metallopeptidase [Firmicutes bacterium]|nr:M20 family metallopeptidase [Bacillota bacterium]